MPAAGAVAARGRRNAAAPAQPAPGWRRPLKAGWRFLPDPEKRYRLRALPASGWRAIRVSLSIQAQFADLRDFAGAGWYRLRLRLPVVPAGDHLLLKIGACDYRCSVYLNGRLSGSHSGGYTPFRADLTRARRQGWNDLVIRIADPPGPPAAYARNFAQIPHGKQNWYVGTSGIWQPAWLELKPAYYLRYVHVLATGRRVTGLAVALEHPGRIPAGVRAGLRIFSPRGRLAYQARLALPRGLAHIRLPLAWRGRHRWSPAHPALYRFRLHLPDGDALSGHFGLRTISERQGRMYLNGRLYYMRAALDQNFYPRGIYTPPSRAYIEHEMRLAKAMGLNTLRLHIQIPDPRYLQAADRVGLLIWYEIPNWDRLTSASRRRGRATLREATDRDWNHPALILQSIINESWGADLRRANQRRWLRGMYVWAKRILPNRLVDDNSACCSNFHIQTDLADFHQYFSMPDHASAWNAWVKQFAARPKWLFSPYGDAHSTGEEPLVVSEFGNWGLPRLPQRLPWWFDRGFGKRRVTLPAGVHARLRHSALGRIFPRYRLLARATEEHQWQALRYEIESLRREPSIQGYVITEFTDCNWEANGLLTMWRRPKAYFHRLAALQRPIVVLARADRPDYAPGAIARIRLEVSNESTRTLRGARLAIAGQSVAVPAVAAGAVLRLPMQRITIRRRTTGWQTLPLRLWQGASPARSRTLDARRLRLAVVASLPESRLRLHLAAAHWRGLARRLRRRGYRLGAHGVWLAHSWSPALAAASSSGARILLLADHRQPLPRRLGIRLVARTGKLSGDWVSNFNWLDTSRAPFAFLRGFNPIQGAEAAAVVPRILLSPVSTPAQGEVLSGFFLGWLHQQHPTSLLLRLGAGLDRPGKQVHAAGRRGQKGGWLLVTTLPLASTYGRDPYATAMLDSMLEDLAGSPRAAPRS